MEPMLSRKQDPIVQEAEAYLQPAESLMRKSPIDMTEAELHRALRLSSGGEPSESGRFTLPSADALVADVERALYQSPSFNESLRFTGGYVNGEGTPIALQYATMRLLQEIRDELRRLNR